MKVQVFIMLALGILIVGLPIFMRTTRSGQSPTASFTYSPSIPGPGDIITFDASASLAPGGSITSYSWDFGDGVVTTTSNAIITYSYPLDGNYTVQLTVTDNGGLTGISVAVIQVLKEVDFRVSYAGTVIPLPNAQVTVYYNNGTAWVPAPARPSNPGVAVIYDNMTQPNIVTQYRNPGFTASILLYNATNIGFDLHSSGNNMIVFFKFQKGSQTAYWPDNITTYYTYDKTHGTAVAKSFSPDEQPYWDPAASTYVIKAAHIKSSECAPIVLGIFCPPPPQQYSLTVKTDPLGVTTIPGQGLYANGTNVVLTAPAYVSVSTSSQYRFNYWDVDGTSRGSGVNPITVLMTANHTATAHYITQYYLKVSSAYDSPTPVSGWFDSGTGMTASVTSPAAGSAGIQYVCTGWTGTGSAPASGASLSTSFIITQPSNITWNWKTQYYLTVTSTHGTTGGQGWYDSGVSAYASVSPLTVSGGSGVQYVFTQWSGDASGSTSPSNAIVMNGPKTATAGWKTQYYLTVTSAYGSTGGQGWYDGGSTAYATVSPLTVSGGSGVQYVFTQWSGDGSGSTSPSNPITMNGPKTAVAGWKTQYYLTVSSAYGAVGGQGWYDSGVSAYASVSPLTVSGGSGVQYVFTQWSGDATGTTSPSNAIVMSVPKAAAANWKTQYYLTVVSARDSPSPVSGWFDSGTGITASVTSPAAGSAGTQYVCTGWIGTGSVPGSGSGTSTAFTISQPSNITWNWKTQYYLTVSSAYGTTGGQGWYDSGSAAYATVSPLVVAGPSGTQYVFTSWSGDASGSTSPSNAIVMNGPKTAAANWKTQYYLTVSSAYGSTGGQGWYDGGSTAYATVSPLTVAGPVGTQYVFTSWSGDASGNTSPSNAIVMNGPKAATANWKTQYYLTVTSAYGTVGGQGWYDSGTTAYATVTPLIVAGSSGTQYVFTQWSGDASGNTSPSDPIVMSGPSTASANWKTQYYLTVSSVYGSTGGQGWYDSGATAYATVTPLSVPGPSGTQYAFDYWSGDASGSTSPSNAIVMNGPKTATANWKTQYYLTVSSAYGSTGGQGWYDGGSTAYATVSPLTVAGPVGTQYVFTSWSGDASGNTSPSNAIVMNGPKAATANWKTQYYLSMVTDPPGVTSPSGAGWYEPGTNATISTPAFVDITPGSSRYRFNGWTTSNITEIADPTRSPTTALMDEAKTITANYAVQYNVSFSQSGVGIDFAGTIVTVDVGQYNTTSLPHQTWWDNGSSHTFSFSSPLIVTANSKQYVWDSTSGISTLQSGSLTVTASGNVKGNYQTQYYLRVYSLYDSPNPPSGWFNTGIPINANVALVTTGPPGTQYVCTGWTGTGSVAPSGTSNSVSFTISQPSNITWNWKTQYYLTVKTDPNGITTIPGEAWYDEMTSATLTAPTVQNYNFSYWDVDGPSQGIGVNPINVAMNTPHTATAHYSGAAGPITVAISPTIVTIPLGSSVTFASTVSGGSPPYSYQWYLGNTAVPGATSDSWTFTPSSGGTFFVYLGITDANNNTASSTLARVTVVSTAIGGYSISFAKPTPITPTVAYFGIVAFFGLALIFTKRKRK